MTEYLYLKAIVILAVFIAALIWAEKERRKP